VRGVTGGVTEESTGRCNRRLLTGLCNHRATKLVRGQSLVRQAVCSRLSGSGHELGRSGRNS